MTYIHNNQGITFCEGKYVSFSDEKNNNFDKRRCGKINYIKDNKRKEPFMKEFVSNGYEIYELNDMNEIFIKPHFEVDYKWSEINHKKRDEIIMDCCIIIVEHFDCDFNDICILYDEKPSKCSLHFNICNQYTTMNDLVRFKKEHCNLFEKVENGEKLIGIKDENGDFIAGYFDPAIYRTGQNKWRTIYATKVDENKKPLTNGLQKIEFLDLNIEEKDDYEYLITYTEPYMKRWTYKEELENEETEKRGLKINENNEEKNGVSKSNSSGYERTTDKYANKKHQSNPKNPSLILDLINIIDTAYIQDHKCHSTMVKGLIKDDYVEEAKILFDKYVSSTGKNLKQLWNEWMKDAPKRKYSTGTLFYYAKQSNKEEYANIMRKYCKTSLPPPLHNDLFVLKNGKTDEINEKYLNDEVLDIILKNQVTYIRSHLGTGKTTLMKKLIKKFPDKKIIYFAPRITFAKQVCSELVGFTYYGDLKQYSLPSMKEKIVIQMESLHKVEEIDYDIVIVDEIESCLKQLSSVDTMKHNILKNHKIFEKILQNAEKVICCDAFLSNKSIQVVNMIVNKTETKTTSTIINTYNPYKRKAFEMKNDEVLIKQLIKDLNEGKKIVFVCGSKSKAETIIQDIKSKCPSKKTLFYYGNMDEHQKVFNNVNEKWNDVDLLIYTPVITCGVNYDPEIPTFHKLYIYGTPHSACVRDVFQSSLRVRKLIDNECFYCISKVSNNRENYEIGLEENYRMILEKKQFVNDKHIFSFEKVNDWVIWNYAYNLNEEGIKLKYYREAFYDYLKVCGYENHKIEYKKTKQSIEGTYVELNDIREINYEEYGELTKNYYKLTESEKNSMKLFEMNAVFELDDDLWIQLQRKPEIVENIKVEFLYGKEEYMKKYIEENGNSKYINQQSIDIYDKNYVLKIDAIEKLNKMLNADNSLKVEYKNSYIKENMNDFVEYIEENRPLWGLRKFQGKEYTVRYINSCIHSIYSTWNGCEFKKKRTKTKQQQDYRYIQLNNDIYDKIRKNDNEN